MNSFDVPYDENLFESNEFMKSYWERSTENRNVAFVQDLRSNETMNDDSELRDLSMGLYDDDELLDSSVTLPEPPKLVDSSFNKKRSDPTVTPKEVSKTTAIVWALIAIGAIFIFLINTKKPRLRE